MHIVSGETELGAYRSNWTGERLLQLLEEHDGQLIVSWDIGVGKSTAIDNVISAAIATTMPTTTTPATTTPATTMPATTTPVTTMPVTTMPVTTMSVTTMSATTTPATTTPVTTTTNRSSCLFSDVGVAIEMCHRWRISWKMAQLTEESANTLSAWTLSSN